MGTFKITVRNASNEELISSQVLFTVENPVPVINHISPSAVWIKAEGFNLIIEGDGFVPGIKLLWNGEEMAATYFSSHRIGAAIPSEKLLYGRVVYIVVVNPAPGGVPRTPLNLISRIEFSYPLYKGDKKNRDCCYQDVLRDRVWPVLPPNPT